MKPANNEVKPVMVIDDSPEDFEVLVRALNKSGIQVPIMRCKDGNEALDFLLYRRQPSSLNQYNLPALILLDLNMPGTDGFNVLETIKGHERLRSIPTIVLSTSRSGDDVRRSYESGANSYIPKPDDMTGYVAMAQIIKAFWFDCATLPTEGP